MRHNRQESRHEGAEHVKHNNIGKFGTDPGAGLGDRAHNQNENQNGGNGFQSADKQRTQIANRRSARNSQAKSCTDQDAAQNLKNQVGVFPFFCNFFSSSS